MPIPYRSADGPCNREILGLRRVGILTVANIAQLKIYFNYHTPREVAKLPSFNLNGISKEGMSGGSAGQ